MSNLLQDHLQKSEDDLIEYEVLPTSCENSEPSSNIAAAQESNNDATLAEGESSLDVLKFSTNHAMIEQLLVELSLIYICHKMICLIFLVIKMTYMIMNMRAQNHPLVLN